jgi:hypothetical protein
VSAKLSACLLLIPFLTFRLCKLHSAAISSMHAVRELIWCGIFSPRGNDL